MSGNVSSLDYDATGLLNKLDLTHDLLFLPISTIESRVR